jgi:ATP-dependent RNA helicase DDX59
MLIPRGVKRKHSNAIYSPDSIKHAKPISSTKSHGFSLSGNESTSNQLVEAVTDNEDERKEEHGPSSQLLEANVQKIINAVDVISDCPTVSDVAVNVEKIMEHVKQTSVEQRFPLDGEPVCVVCGRYGEYISDTTERDVCSIECKLKDIANYARNPVKDPICQGIAFPQYSIATNVHAKLTAYHDSPDISTLHPKTIETMRSAHDIVVQGQNVPRPVTSFENCQLHVTLLENIKRAGFLRPTPVQMQALPVALAGRDMLVSAPTSSGKTVSYLVPLITHCLSLAKMYGNGHQSCPLGLIIAPTRELCAQIEEVAKQLAAGLPHMKTALLIGGNPIPNQLYRLQQGVQILVTTPGRMIELINHHKSALKLENIKMVIVDEVDIMFKMGFNEQVARILNSLVEPGIRQTCFYSATWESEEVMRKTCRKQLRNSITVHVGKTKFQPRKHVKQTIMWVEDQSKSKQLISILRDPKYYEPPILIFVDSKLATELLAQAIRTKCGFNVLAMHGDLSQAERDDILQQVRQSNCDIVVATGVLARGIDLQNVRMVINYDMANTVDEYIHQVGRAMVTGIKAAHGTKQHTRKQGWAITFINNVSIGLRNV